MRRWMRAPMAVAAALLLVLALSDAWGGRYRGRGGNAERRRAILKRMAAEPELLINLDATDMPSTTDIIRLGRRATPAVVNGLVNSMSEEVRQICAAVLGGTRDPAALDALVDALDDPDASVRRYALRALGAVESHKATPRLLGLLTKPGVSYSLKAEAVRALGRIGDPAAVKPLLRYFRSTWDAAAQRALWDLRRQLSQRQLRSIVIDPLKVAGKDGGPSGSVLRFSVERSGELRVAAAAGLLRKMFPEQRGLQNRIIYNLGRIGERSSIPFLEQLLDRTADARLLNNVTFALQRLGKDPKPFLRAALGDRRAYIRFNGAFVAGDLKEQGVVPELLVALEDRNDYVRSEAAVALGKVGAGAATAALEKASHESNPIVRRDALLALASSDYETHRKRVLEELVGSKTRSVRERALRFLAERVDPTVIPAALAALDPGDYRDCNLGLSLLRPFDSLDSPEATAFLLRLASRGGHRHEALVLLARFADERARFVLRQWVESPEGEQNQLLRAMGRLREASAADAARRWLEADDDPSAQLHGAYVLAAIGDAAGREALLSAIEQSPVEAKRVAALLWTQLEPEQASAGQPALVKLLEHDDVYVRLYAARALLRSGDEGAFELLRTELDRRIPFVRDEVLDILERSPAAHRDPVVSKWLGSVDAHVRRELERILGGESA